MKKHVSILLLACLVIGAVFAMTSCDLLGLLADQPDGVHYANNGSDLYLDEEKGVLTRVAYDTTESGSYEKYWATFDYTISEDGTKITMVATGVSYKGDDADFAAYIQSLDDAVKNATAAQNTVTYALVMTDTSITIDGQTWNKK